MSNSESGATTSADAMESLSSPFRGSKQTTFSGLIHDGIFSKNPVFVLALSLCPAVAVTNSVQTSLAMGLAVLFVMSFNNLFTSLFRHRVHPKVRMPAFILIIATLVTTCELFMSAFFPAVYRALGVYLKLIVVFAIILARAEVFASKNRPLPALMDGFGMGLGLALARNTAKDMGGSIDLRSRVGVGTEVEVLLPTLKPNSAFDSADDRGGAAHGQSS